MAIRTLAPAGGFPSPLDLFAAWTAARDGAAVALARELEARFKTQVLLTGSGKEALESVFTALAGRTGRRMVAIAAYTCPDIAAAAVRAGFSVLPLDIDAATLEPSPSAAGAAKLADAACLVLSNLYGLPDRIEPWRELAEEHGVTIVDDACQALRSSRGQEMVGAGHEAVGIASFGRGKALCAVGGGAVLWNRHRELAGQSGSDDGKNRTAAAHEGGAAAAARNLLDLAKLCGAWLFQRPSLYAIPERLLGLGSTSCRLDYPSSRLGSIQALAALSQLRRGRLIEDASVAAVRQYETLLADSTVVRPFAERRCTLDGSVVLIRYPLVFPTAAARDRALQKLASTGLGASRSYPKALQEFDELQPHIEAAAAPQAEDVARRILTLPTHPHVTADDIRRIADIVQEA